MKRTTDLDPLLDDMFSAIAADTASIVRRNDEQQIAYGVVYTPGEVDSHGDAMSAKDVEDMAHRFLRRMVEAKGAVIDVEHDNRPVAVFPVESYIETAEDKDWPAGSWIMGVKVEDAGLWQRIKRGELNGFSFEAMVQKMPTVVQVEADPDYLGVTSKSEGHDHLFFLEFDENGRISAGRTSYDNGHSHAIRAGTATEIAGGAGFAAHAHRLPVA